MQNSHRMIQLGLLGVIFQMVVFPQAFVGLPTLSPSSIGVNNPSVVIIGALIPSPPTTPVIPTSVNVLRVDQTGRTLAIVGSLNDLGFSGDSIAADNIFGGTISLTETTTGFVYLQVSAAFRGTLRRSLSSIIGVEVVAPGAPTTLAPFNSSQLVVDPSTNTSVVCDDILISFKDTATTADVAAAITSVNGSLIGRDTDLGLYEVKLPTCTLASLNTALDSLRSLPVTQNATADMLLTLHSAYFPNDLHNVFLDTSLQSHDQWWQAQVGLPQAWGIIRTGATIGIIDDGVNGTHEDLASSIVAATDWCQFKDTNGCVVGGGAQPQPGDFHGTVMAGLAAAIADNGKGIAGAAFHAGIIAERVTDGTSIDLKLATNGIKNAVAKGARVINLSFGCSALVPACPAFGGPLADAIAYALARGVTVVASAGNDDSAYPSYPAVYSGVISVGASDRNNARSKWAASRGGPCNAVSETAPASNYGPWIDIYAPGSEMIGLNSAVSTGSGAYSYLCNGGTSSAAPIVSGTVALMLAVNPSLFPADVKAIIKSTALHTGKLDQGDHGSEILLLNAGAAVQAAAQFGFHPPLVAGFTITSGTQSVRVGQTLNILLPVGMTTASFTLKTISGGDLSLDGVPLFSLAPQGTFTFPAGVGRHTVGLELNGAIVESTIAVSQPLPSIPPNDAFSDFSLSSNPNGNWSYGYTNGLGNSISLHTTAETDFVPGVNRWTTPALNDFYFMIAKNITGNPISLGTANYPTDMLWMHPSIPNWYNVVRWTAPVSGIFSLSGKFAGLDVVTSVADTDVHILRNSTTDLLPSTVLRGLGTEQPFSFTLDITVGETFDFAVGRGPSGFHQNDSTGLKVTITPQ